MHRLPRWLLVVFALTLLALLGGGAAFYTAQRQYVQQEAEKNLLAIAQLKVDEIVRWRAQRLADAAVLAESPLLAHEVARWLADPQQPPLAEDLRTRFRSLQTHYGYSDVALVDAAGQVRLSLEERDWPLHEGIGQALADAFRQRRPVILDLHEGHNGAAPHLGIVAPLFAEANAEPLGAIVLQADASQFLYPLIQSWPVPSASAETLLVRREGDKVVFLNELRHQKGAALKLRVPLTSTDVPAVQAVLGRQGVVNGRDYRGVQVISAIEPIPDSPWFMVAKMDEAEAMAAWRYRSTAILVLIGAAVLAAAGAMGLVWQRSGVEHFRALYRAEAAARANEARYRATLLSVGDGVIATDAQGRVAMLNPVAEALTGWPQQDVQGKPLTEVFTIINEETRQPAVNPVERALREGVVVGLANHTLLVARDGRERPISDSAAPIRDDDDGAVSGVVLVFRDQTAERAAQAALQSESRNLRAIISSSPIGMMIINRQEQVILANSAAERLFATSLADLDSPRCGDVLSCVNRHDRPRGCGYSARCALCPLAAAIRAVLAGEAALHEQEHEFQLDARDACEARWLRYGVEGVMLGGERHAIVAVEDVTDRKRAEQALRASETLYRRVAENMEDVVWTVGNDLRFTYISPSIARLRGLTPEEALIESIEETMTPASYDVVRDILARRAVTQAAQIGTDLTRFEAEQYHKAGHTVWVEILVQPLYNNDQMIGYLGVSRNITERKRAEVEREALQAQLSQAQKMETVGRLAGGVAHDFNNLLTVINGYSDMLLADLAPDALGHDELREINQAGARAASLTAQLLAFSRRQMIAPRVLDLNDELAGMTTMLTRLIGEDIRLKFQPGASLGHVRADPHQLQQVVLNLAVNARDAMPSGGALTIETANANLDVRHHLRDPEIAPGPYAMLAISDTGVGMTAEVQSHLFEPFFTTKGVGKGTGLGLSMVYGIVKQAGGTVSVYSEPGQGTTFRIYLPRVDEALPSERVAQGALPRGRETILVIEDSADVRRFTVRLLQSLGYNALEAASGPEALALAEQHAEPIHLLLTDVVMPHMSGREAAEKLVAQRPTLKVLYMSGYTDNAIVHRGVLDEGMRFINKPFTPEALARQVRAALDAR